jgi:hypothetical protein
MVWPGATLTVTGLSLPMTSGLAGGRGLAVEDEVRLDAAAEEAEERVTAGRGTPSAARLTRRKVRASSMDCTGRAATPPAGRSISNITTASGAAPPAP